MSPPLSPEVLRQVLSDLGVGKLPTPAEIREELESEWLRPSVGGRKELSSIEWAM